MNILPKPMYITKTMRTETGHRLVNYMGKCAHLHGHSYKWEVTISGKQLDQRGMIADFGDLKAAMKAIIEPLDHALILSEEDPLIRGSISELEHLLINGEKNGPPRLIVLPVNPTAENLILFVASGLQDVFREAGIIDFKLHRIRVHETATSFAETYFNHE